MPTYVNPSTMMGAQLNPRSALNGALAGVQGAYATKMGDQQIRAEDLSFMENMHKFQQSVLDDPMNEAIRGEKTAAAGYNTDQITSGRALDAFNTEQEGKKLGNEGKSLSNIDAATQLKGEFLNRLAGELDNFNQQDPATVAAWNMKVEEGQKIGVQLPSWPSEQTKSQIKTRAATFVDTIKHQQKQSEIKTTADYELRNRADPRLVSSVEGATAVENARGRNALDRVQETAAASMENARTKAASTQRFGTLDKVLAPLLIEKIAKEAAAGGLSEATLQQAVGYADSRAEEELAGHPTSPLLKMAGMNDPAKAAAALEIKKEKISTILDSLGINKAGQAAAGKVVNSPANPGAKPGGGPISSKAEYDALPPGTAYTWNGKAGVKR